MLQDRQCIKCKTSFKGGPRAYYCPNCRDERTKETNRNHKRKKRLGLTRSIGSKDTCERCGEQYTVEAGLQRFCPDCQPIHAAEYDRKTALPFYHANKERINPPRKIRRRKRGNICAWCRKEFEPENGSTTCSDECKRQDINRYQRERGKRIRAEHARPDNSYTTSEIAREIGRNRTTVLSWYKAGKLSEPNGYEKRGNPYWLISTISPIIDEHKTDPTST